MSDKNVPNLDDHADYEDQVAVVREFHLWREAKLQQWLVEYLPMKMKLAYKKYLVEGNSRKAIKLVRRAGLRTIVFQKDPWMFGISKGDMMLAAARWPRAPSKASMPLDPPMSDEELSEWDGSQFSSLGDGEALEESPE